MTASDEDDGNSEITEAREAALAAALQGRMVGGFHAPHPFALGGNANVVVFELAQGRAYVTSELTGRPDACYADYELMVCHRDESEWGAEVVSRLAPYTQEAFLAAGDTMPVNDADHPESEIRALLFDTF